MSTNNDDTMASLRALLSQPGVLQQLMGNVEVPTSRETPQTSAETASGVSEQQQTTSTEQQHTLAAPVASEPMKRKLEDVEGDMNQHTGNKRTAVRASDGSLFWELGNAKKRLAVTKWSGNTYVNIREWYSDKDSGEMKPTRKGLMLNKQAYLNLKQLVLSGVVDDAIEAVERG